MSRYVSFDSLNMLKGPYKGDSIYDVADEDSEYLQNILENGSPDDSDRELIETALGFPDEEE